MVGPLPVFAGGGERLARLLDIAKERELHREPAWLGLLHYERSLLPLRAPRSHAGAERFFFAADGARNPGAELRATLSAFADPDRLDEDGQHASCAFPARWRWLRAELGPEMDALPRPLCPDYAHWRKGLSARGLSLVYPEGFMSQPASMFGHTLLRLDLSRTGGSEDVLSYAVDFTGDTGSDAGPFYVVKGLFGLYPGRFGIKPYYRHLERYGGLENRDIWEYRLALEERELEALLEHLWELRAVDFPYYFFDENCSYQLLELIRAVRPDVEKRTGFPLAVIPADTLRAATAVPGLVKEIEYRPSKATELRAHIAQLDEHGIDFVRKLVSGELSPSARDLEALPDRRRAAVLEVAYEWLRYAYLTGQVTEADSRGLSRQLLLARSRIPLEAGAGPVLDAPPRPAVRPDEAHGTAMVSMLGGVEHGDGYLEWRVRPALHDLLDPPGGYPPHMQIAFFDARLRYYPGLARVRLQEFVAIEALSITPAEHVVRPIAWGFDTGLRTRRVRKGADLQEKAVWRTDIAAGLSHGLGPHLVGYGLVALGLDAGPGLQDGASFGPGVRFGLQTRGLGETYGAELRGRYLAYLAGDPTHALDLGLLQRVRVARNHSLEFEASYRRIESQDWAQLGIGWRIYF
jgi:hypothetical protein